MSSPDYKKANYDQILFRVKKGKRDEYRAAAENLGLGFWALIQNGVEEYIQNHAGEVPAVKLESEKLSTEERKLVDEFNRLPPDARRSLMKFLHAINEHSSPMGGQSCLNLA